MKWSPSLGDAAFASGMLAAGTRVGPQEAVSWLGAGGMGEVCRAASRGRAQATSVQVGRQHRPPLYAELPLRRAGANVQGVVSAEDVAGPEWAEWYRLTPEERFGESEKLWQTYLVLGGSLDPEPDTQSPFFDPGQERARPAHGRAGLRVVRRGRI